MMKSLGIAFIGIMISTPIITLGLENSNQHKIFLSKQICLPESSVYIDNISLFDRVIKESKPDVTDKTKSILKISSIISNITFIAGEHSMELRWDIVSPDDFQKVLIKRNGKVIGESTTSSFTETSLLANYEYIYDIVPVSNDIEQTGFSITTNTLSDGVDFRGLTDSSEKGYAFDGNLDTCTTVSRGDYFIDWSGNLNNKNIDITIAGKGTANTRLGFRDASGKKVDFIHPESREYTDVMNLPVGKTTLTLLIPENAIRIILYSASALQTIDVYNINVIGDSVVPESIYNVISESSEYAINLNWDNPINSAFEKAILYRNNTKIAEGNINEFCETSLLSDSEYTYTLFAMDISGYLSHPATYTARTTKAEINFKGLEDSMGRAYAFDGNLDTYSTVSKGDYFISWDKDLQSKIIEITISGAGNTNTRLGFRTSAGTTAIPFRHPDTGEYVSVMNIPSGKTTLTLLVPENASRIILYSATSAYKINVYNIGFGKDLIEPNIQLTPSITLGYTNQDLDITVKATDNVSVDFIELPDGTIVNSDTSTYTVSQNGQYIFKATDTSGNIAEESIIISNIDKEKPQISLKSTVIDKPSAAVKVIITATDNTGIEKIILPDATEVTASTGEYITDIDEMLEFTAIDVAGNNTKKTINIVQPVKESDINILFKQPQTLSVALSNNTIDFGEVTGLEDVEKINSISLRVSSSSPYDVNLKALDDIKGNNDSSSIIDISKLSVKSEDIEYRETSKNYIPVLNNKPKGVDINHSFNFKLSSTLGAKSDRYSVPLKINVSQR